MKQQESLYRVSNNISSAFFKSRKVCDNRGEMTEEDGGEYER